MTESEQTGGIQELIDRLSREGVETGQRRADEIVATAEQQADEIVAAARREAQEIRDKARRDAEQYQAAGEQALELAARDTLRDFGARIHEGWRMRVERLVEAELDNPELLKEMILEVSRVTGKQLEEGAVEVLIPHQLLSDAEAAEQVRSGEPDALTSFVKGLVGSQLREGMTFSLGDSDQRGLVIRRVNEHVEIDVTDEALTELFSRHLLPRFRAVMKNA